MRSHLVKKDKKLSIQVLLTKCRESDRGIYNLAIRIIYRRQKKEYSLGWKIHQSNFTESSQRVCYTQQGIIKRKDQGIINRLIKEEREGVLKSFQFLERMEPGFNLERLMLKHRRDYNNQYVEAFVVQCIDELKAEGKQSTANAYLSSMNSLKRFFGTQKLMFREIDYIFVVSYIHHLRTRGMTENTVGMYLSNLRAIYNKARKLGVNVGKALSFSDLKIQPQETLKRSLTKEDIANIATCDLKENHRLAQARDLFMFSFYCRGMSFVDVIHLKHTSFINGTISYERNKTGQRLQVGLLPVLKAIAEIYRTNSPYVFPYLDPSSGRPLYTQYRYALGTINRHLKHLGSVLGIQTPLTTYVARHSWATIAKKEGFSIATISEGLGHTSEETTKIYLQSFSNETIDKINEGVSEAVHHCIEVRTAAEIRP